MAGLATIGVGGLETIKATGKVERVKFVVHAARAFLFLAGEPPWRVRLIGADPC
jgi:hypothetical protein